MDLNAIPEDQLDNLLQAVEELAKKSPLDYVPHPANPKTGFPGMKDFHCSPARVRVVFGGNQSGKTVGGANELLFHATGLYPEWYPLEQRYNRPIKARITGEDYTKWGKVLEDKLLEWLPAELIVHKGRTLKGALESIQIRHKSGGISVIDIMTHEQDDGVFESWTGDLAWFDEPPPRSKYTATMRGLMAQGGRCIFTVTLLKEPWIYDKFVLDKDKDSELETNSYVIYLNIRDNVTLKEKDIRWFLSQVPEDERDTRESGKARHLAGRVYKEFDESIHIVNESLVKIKSNWPVYFVCDPHDRKPHHGLWFRVSPTNTVYVTDEIQFTGTIKEFSKAVRVREAMKGIRSDEVIRVGDPNKMKTPSAMNGLTFQQEFAGEDNPYKLYFNVDVNDDITLGHLTVKRYLSWNREKPLSSTNCPKIYFLKEYTKQCVKQLLTYVWDEWRGTAKDSKSAKETPKDVNKDFPDCIRYGLVFGMKYYGQDDEITYSPSEYTGYGHSIKQEPENNKTKFSRFD